MYLDCRPEFHPCLGTRCLHVYACLEGRGGEGGPKRNQLPVRPFAWRGNTCRALGEGVPGLIPPPFFFVSEADTFGAEARPEAFE